MVTGNSDRPFVTGNSDRDMVNPYGESVRRRVLIADDHAPTRLGVRAALEEDGFDVVAEASTAREAIDQAMATAPDACLLDVYMPGNGNAAAEEIARRLPGTAVVMLTYSREEADLFSALRAGAQGFLNKDMNPDRLGAALRGVLQGEAALPRTLVARVLEEFRARPSRPGAPQASVAGARLTNREREIMELLARGGTTEQVAEQLYLSPATVRVHVSNVVRKLKAPDRQAALEAYRGSNAKVAPPR